MIGTIMANKNWYICVKKLRYVSIGIRNTHTRYVCLFYPVCFVSDSLLYAVSNFEGSDLDPVEGFDFESLASDSDLTSVNSLLNQKSKRCIEKHTKNRRKYLLNSGQEYVSTKGKIKTEKKLGLVCSNTCYLKCYKIFDTNIRQKIFRNFWNLGDHAKQWEYINKFSEKVNKRRITVDYPSRRKYTKKYYLPLLSNGSDQFSSDESVQVCQKTFLNTLSITQRMVNTAHNKLNQDGITLPDGRGKHLNHHVVRTPEMVKSVSDHVASLRSDLSHNNLSMKEMFCLYKEWDQLKNYGDKAHTLRQYSDLAKEHFKKGQELNR
jgi:hypothetical protein